MNWYLECFRKYATFSGRARRSEYWNFVLFNFLAALIFGFLDRLLFPGSAQGQGPLSGVYNLVALLPTLAVTVRRMHDTNRNGWIPFWLMAGPGIAYGFTLASPGVIDVLSSISPDAITGPATIIGYLGNLSPPLLFVGLFGVMVGTGSVGPFFLMLASIAISIYWLTITAQDSQLGDNIYGAYPK